MSLSVRHAVALDTLARTPALVASTPSASLSSSLLSYDSIPPLPTSPSQLPPALTPLIPPLPPSSSHPAFPPTTITVHPTDAYTLARALTPPSTSTSPSAPRTAVLNLASDEHPAGGWLHTLSRTQEESLCYTSTLYPTLAPTFYPWPNRGPASHQAILSPGVLIFRSDLETGLAELHEADRRVVQVISVAAPRYPALTAAGAGAGAGAGFADAQDAEDVRRKVRLACRIAAWAGARTLVLGALGCGAYRCPPRAVARTMRDVLQEKEFAGWFARVAFAVYVKEGEEDGSNYAVFGEVLRGVLV